MNRLLGIHAVREALLAGHALDRILIARGRRGERVEEVVELARRRGVPVRFEERGRLDRLAEGARHQGVVAFVAAERAVALEELLTRDATPGLLVLLDGVEDPRNLGAIIRTALAAGARGIVIPTRRAAGLTEAVARTSAGALEYLPVARVSNLSHAVDQLKRAGYWLVGLDERGERSYLDADFTGRVAIVLGGEGRGLHELTRKRCDFLVSIPAAGPIRSLNVSVAAGIVLFEAARQRKQARASGETAGPG
jgi:23S rRNA (guanosine2251-2'-O)-methyltransferase